MASTADGVIVKTSGGLADEWTYRRYKPEDVWSFRPVVKPAVPGSSLGNPDRRIPRSEAAGSRFRSRPPGRPAHADPSAPPTT